jgi:MEMO1 family protein
VVRKAAVAGRWYPGTERELARAVDGYLDQAGESTAIDRSIAAIIAPHAGLMYSGPIAAYAYRQVQNRGYDVAFIVGPSHFVPFEGVAIDLSDGFDTPLGVAELDRESASHLMAAASVVHEYPDAHGREHSLEMQLPFLKRVSPSTRIVPLLVGRQTPQTAGALARGLADAARGRGALLIASTDLSHYYDASTAARLDKVVLDRVAASDDEGLERELERRPDHACGGAAVVAVMRAARLLGARRATILKYGDSGDVSGDKTSVVGYLAAAISHDQPS